MSDLIESHTIRIDSKMQRIETSIQKLRAQMELGISKLERGMKPLSSKVGLVEPSSKEVREKTPVPIKPTSLMSLYVNRAAPSSRQTFSFDDAPYQSRQSLSAHGALQQFAQPLSVDGAPHQSRQPLFNDSTTPQSKQPLLVDGVPRQIRRPPMSRKRPAEVQSSADRNRAKPQQECIFCRSLEHAALKCQALPFLEQRKLMVNAAGRCERCFCLVHTHRKCCLGACPFCAQPHHGALCKNPHP